MYKKDKVCAVRCKKPSDEKTEDEEALRFSDEGGWQSLHGFEACPPSDFEFQFRMNFSCSISSIIRGISYSYSLLWRFRVITVPAEVEKKLCGESIENPKMHKSKKFVAKRATKKVTK